MAAFDEAPTSQSFAHSFNADRVQQPRERLAAWLAGKASPGVVGSSDHYGRSFNIQTTISYCEQLLSDIENAQVALGDRPAASIPRYAREGNNNWSYMEPGRNYFAVE